MSMISRSSSIWRNLRPSGVCKAPACTKLLTMPRGLATANGPSLREFAATMPPNFEAKVGQLETFSLPESVTGTPGDYKMGKALIDAWRRDGILQIQMQPNQAKLANNAFHASKRFFDKPSNEKASCVDSQSFSGYIASGEELTDGIRDYSEIFTVTKDLDLSEPRVKNKWPCHGPVPWPDIEMKEPVQDYMDSLGSSGEKLLQLIELGLDLPFTSLTKYVQDGWHHMRVLRFPATSKTNGKGKEGRGIGSHTDYGLLVIAAQDDVGGLFIRPPHEKEQFANWEKSSAGLNEEDDQWTYVPPAPGVFTVFPGDMLQYMTGSYLPSTPHKVGLNTRERFAFAYFHEPSFQAVLKPLPGYDVGQTPRNGVHYGTHFTNMFLRNYPERITTQRLQNEDREKMLEAPELRAIV